MKATGGRADYSERGLWTDERIGWLLSSAAGRWGDREFINYDGTRYGFDSLNRWVTATAVQMLSRGVEPGDRVILHLGNSLELIVLQFAAWRIGAVSVPIVPIYRSHELTSIIAETRPTLIASCVAVGASTRKPYQDMEEIFRAAPEFAPPMKILVGGAADVDGWDRVRVPPPAGEHISEVGLPSPADAAACCTILYTSGTTSRPKGAMLNSRALIANIQTWRLGLGLSASDVAMSGAPLAHIGAQFSALMVPLGLGAKTTILPLWDPDRAIQWIAKEKVTFMAGATVFLQDLVERYERGESPDYRIKIFASGGAPTPPILIERAHKLGIFAFRVYGMTETAGTLTLSPVGTDTARCANCDGRIAFGAEMEIVDAEDRVLPHGETGTVRIRSPQLMMGYTDPEATRQLINAENWLYPGDVGKISEDGWWTMTGRTKDIVNRGGEKFSCQDIEAILASFPDVRRAAVTGLPDSRLGETVAAFLVLADGVTWSGPDRVIEHLEAKRLARQKFPAKWYLLDALPVSASGKVQKHKLVELAAEVEAGVGQKATVQGSNG